MKCTAQGIVATGVLLIVAVGSPALQAQDQRSTVAMQRPAGPDESGPLKVIDIELHGGNTLAGLILDQQGTPVAAREVQLNLAGQMVARSTSDDQGRFHFNNIRSGTYAVVSGQDGGVFRAWAQGTAPPVAQPQAVVYTGMVTRGFGLRPRGIFASWKPSLHPAQWANSPTTVGAAIGTALALPIALHEDENGS